MPLTAHIIPAKEQAAFEAHFAQAYTEPERLTVARHYLRALLPGDNLRRLYRWRVFPCGRGAHGLRLAIVETVHGWDGARLFLVSGGWFVATSEHASADGAESAAWAFSWRTAEAA